MNKIFLFVKMPEQQPEQQIVDTAALSKTFQHKIFQAEAF